MAVSDLSDELVGGARALPAALDAWRDYVTLTKPRIMSLLVLTAVCAMVAAAHGAPGLMALLAAGRRRWSGLRRGERAQPRARPRHRPADGAAHGLATGGRRAHLAAARDGVRARAVSGLVRGDGAGANLLAAALAVSGGLFYVLVYTLWLKRSTDQNIVIGGAAGAIPVLSGWAAAHGTLGAGAFVLFAIVLLWTPPHFWALALLLERHYAAAGVPMLPVVRGARATTRQVLGYSVLLTAFTLVPGVPGDLRARYLAAAAGLDAVLCALAWRLWRSPGPQRAAVLFHFSLLYLALLFVAVAIDAVVGGAWV